MMIPQFHIPGVLEWEIRKSQMDACVSRELPSFHEQPERKGHITLACYGPSLKRTYRDITGPVLTVAGAHDFLCESGRVPDWCVVADPRPHKALMLERANDKTIYLLASVCHTSVFEVLKGKKIEIWHLYTQPECLDWMKENDHSGVLIYGGSTVGLRCLEIAHALGFRSLDIHGMDSCFDSQETQWAGRHSGKLQPTTLIRVGKHTKPFITSPLMIQQAREFIGFWQTHDIKLRVRGDGMISAMMKQSQPLRKVA